MQFRCPKIFLSSSLKKGQNTVFANISKIQFLAKSLKNKVDSLWNSLSKNSFPFVGTTGCYDPSKRCNCDVNDSEWRKDDGLLTDKTNLPVTEMRFGDVDSSGPSEKGYYTLGDLKCTEQSKLWTHIISLPRDNYPSHVYVKIQYLR